VGAKAPPPTPQSSPKNSPGLPLPLPNVGVGPSNVMVACGSTGKGRRGWMIAWTISIERSGPTPIPVSITRLLTSVLTVRPSSGSLVR